VLKLHTQSKGASSLAEKQFQTDSRNVFLIRYQQPKWEACVIKHTSARIL